MGSVANLLAVFLQPLSDKKRRERYKARIERIRREQGLQELNQAVTREEKDLTVKPMRLTQVQGHWFKCPNGECDFFMHINSLWENLVNNFFELTHSFLTYRSCRNFRLKSV